MVKLWYAQNILKKGTEGTKDPKRTKVNSVWTKNILSRQMDEA